MVLDLKGGEPKWHVKEKVVSKARAAAKVNDLAYKLQTK